MGGDDLGSDDEFLGGGVVVDDEQEELENAVNKKESVLKASTVAVIDDDDDGDGDDDKQSSKRKRKEEELAASSSKKKTPSKKSRLLEAARSIESETAEQQAAFTWTALLHHHQMKEGKDADDTSTSKILEPKLQPHHFTTSSDSSTTMEARLRDVIPSMKQMKTWKHKQSPMVLIISLSARRAVQILKDITPFKTRVAKLFAKHMSVADQMTLLQQSATGMAVGTPHRLQVLCEKGGLNLSQTRLVVLDAHKDAKNFTVCTLPDTAPHCMEFLRDQVLPQLRDRPKDCKLAFC